MVWLGRRAESPITFTSGLRGTRTESVHAFRCIFHRERLRETQPFFESARRREWTSTLLAPSYDLILRGSRTPCSLCVSPARRLVGNRCCVCIIRMQHGRLMQRAPESTASRAALKKWLCDFIKRAAIPSQWPRGSVRIFRRSLRASRDSSRNSLLAI